MTAIPNPENLLQCVEQAHRCLIKYTTEIMESNQEPDDEIFRLIVSLETVYRKLNPEKPLNLSVWDHN